jgi:hypothetical protein
MRFLPPTHSIKEFPYDNRLWKVDWYGDLLPNPNAPSEPLLEVFIAPLNDWVEETEERLSQRSSYNYAQTRKIKIGISFLPFLCLGTFWRNKINQKISLGKRVEFYELQIDSEHSRIIDAKEFQACEDLLVAFPSIKNCLETKFIEIDLPNKPDQKIAADRPKQKILIPSYEVLNSYFAGSSALTRSIFTGGMFYQPNNIFDPTQTAIDGNTGIGKLILRKKMAGTDRYNIARLAFSETAKKAAWGIYSSIAKNFNNNTRCTVEAKFPFIGKTDLQVCGKWFKHSETKNITMNDEKTKPKAIWHFLVYFIESCSHPLPYKKLLWGIEGETKVNQTEVEKPAQTINQVKTDVEKVMEVGNIEEPSLQTIFSETVFEGRKFGDLENKEKEERIKDENPENDSTRYVITTEKVEITREVSTGEGAYGDSKTQGITVKIGENELDDIEIPKEPPFGWRSFTNILTELEKDSSIKTGVIAFNTAMNENVGKSKGIYFPQIVLGKIRSWAYLDKEKTHRRQAMLAEIRKNNKIIYLLDIEVNLENKSDRYPMLVIKNENYGVLDTSFWKQIFEDCVEHKGVERDSWTWENTKFLPVRHDFKELTKYALKISEFF